MAEKNPHNIVVGQELWYTPFRSHRNPCHVTVTKVGRRWVEVGTRLRFDMETLMADAAGYACPGRAYLSKTAWEDSIIADRAWNRLQRRLGQMYSRPAHVTIAPITDVARSFKIDIDDPS